MDKPYITDSSVEHDYHSPRHAGRGAARVVGFADTIALITRRRYFILCFVLFSAALLAIVVLSMRDTYTAAATLVLERSDTQMLEAVTEMDSELRDRSAVETEMDIISSRIFVGRVVDATNLIEHPSFNTYLAKDDEEPGTFIGDLLPRLKKAVVEGLGLGEPGHSKKLPSKSVQRDRAITSFLAHMDVSRNGESFAVTVRVTSPDAELSATLANTAAHVYVDWSRELKKQVMSDAVNFLRERTNQVASRIAENERAITDFTRANELAANERDDLVRKRIDDLNTQLTVARVELAGIRAKREQGRRVIAGTVEVEGSALDSPLLTTLRAEQAVLMRQRAQYASNFASSHPQIVETDAQLASVSTMIGAEIQRIVDDLAGEEKIINDRVLQLDAQLSDLQAILNERSLAEIRLRELERDLLADQKLHDLVVARLGGLDPFAEVAKPSARVVSVAEVPTEPSFPQRGRIFAAGVVGAAVLAVILAVMLEASDMRIWSGQRISQLVQLPNLANIPRTGRSLLTLPANALIRLTKRPRSASTEAYRSLYLACRAQLTLSKAVLLVTAPLSKHGTTSVAEGLAFSSARDGLKTLYVSLDAQSPGLPAVGRSKPACPPAETADGNSDSNDLIRPVPGVSRLDTLMFPRPPGGRQLMPITESESARLLFDDLRASYDLIVIDAAPVLLVEDANWLSPLVDGILLVVRFGCTTEAELVGAVSRLNINRAPLIGTVLNWIDPRSRPAAEPLGPISYPRQARAYFVN